MRCPLLHILLLSIFLVCASAWRWQDPDPDDIPLGYYTLDQSHEDGDPYDSVVWVTFLVPHLSASSMMDPSVLSQIKFYFQAFEESEIHYAKEDGARYTKLVTTVVTVVPALKICPAIHSPWDAALDMNACGRPAARIAGGRKGE